MKHNKDISPLKKYSMYFQYGAAALLTVWLLALATTALLPGPYYMDFFGVVAERTANSSSVLVGWEAFLTAFVLLPIIMTVVDYFHNNSR